MHHSYVGNGRAPGLVGGLLPPAAVGSVAARVAARGFWSRLPLYLVVDRDQNPWGCHRRRVGVDETVRNRSPRGNRALDPPPPHRNPGGFPAQDMLGSCEQLP